MEIQEIIEAIYDLKEVSELRQIFPAAKQRRQELDARLAKKIRRDMKPGQECTYEYRGQTYRCKLMKMRETRAEVMDEGRQRSVLVPIAWLKAD